ncbi:hypothetical protein [Tessaracoccus sp. Z1128]
MADWVAAVAAGLSAVLAVIALVIAARSNVTARGAADAAKRSADAAERANERAMLREEEFHHVNWTVRWQHVPTAGEVEPDRLPDLLVKNDGPDVAFDVKVLFRVGGSWTGMVRLGDISPGDAQPFFPNTNGIKLVSPASEYEGFLPPPDKPAPPRDVRPFPSHEWDLGEDPHELFRRMKEGEIVLVLRWHSAMGRPRQRTYTFNPFETVDGEDGLGFWYPYFVTEDIPAQ